MLTLKNDTTLEEHADRRAEQLRGIWDKVSPKLVGRHVTSPEDTVEAQRERVTISEEHIARMRAGILAHTVVRPIYGRTVYLLPGEELPYGIGVR